MENGRKNIEISDCLSKVLKAGGGNPLVSVFVSNFSYRPVGAFFYVFSHHRAALVCSCSAALQKSTLLPTWAVLGSFFGSSFPFASFFKTEVPKQAPEKKRKDPL